MSLSSPLHARPQTSVPQAAAPLTYASLALLLTLLQWCFFVGFQASDDANYLRGALGWVNHVPYVGDTHWTLRHTLTLPAALSVSGLGLTLFSLGLTTLVYFFGFVAFQVWGLHRHLGFTAAASFGLLAITTTGMVVNSTYLAPDVSELFFVGTTFWLLVRALAPSAVGPVGTSRLWLAAGLLAGLAWSNRQTSAGALVACGLIAWIAGPAARRRIPCALLGFVLIVGSEWLFLTLMTGDPLYRLNVDLHHDPVNRTAEVQRVAASGGWIDKEGNLSVHLLIDPLLALFVSQKYGLLFWTGLLAARQAWRLPPGAERQLLMRLLGLGALSYVFVAANPKLYLVPRYLLVPAWVAAMLTAWWVARLWEQQRRAAATLIAAAVVGVNLLCLSVENTQPRAIERALVAWVKAHPNQSVHTDIETYERAETFFDIAGVPRTTVSSAPAAPGDRVFYSAVRVEQCAGQPRCKAQAAAFRPQPSWVAVETLRGPSKPVGQLIQALHIAPLLPPDIARRILAPSYEVTLYDVR